MNELGILGHGVVSKAIILAHQPLSLALSSLLAQDFLEPFFPLDIEVGFLFSFQIHFSSKQEKFIIYNWKILGLVPNLYTEVTPHETRRQDRICKIAPMKSRSAIGRPRENSINIKGPKLFNTPYTHRA